MTEIDRKRCTAFEDQRIIESGELAQVAQATKRVIDRGDHGTILIFDDTTSRPVEIDFRGNVEDVLARLPVPAEPVVAERPQGDEPVARQEVSADRPQEEPRRGPGRPKLGVVAREVTLLPRHWEWLNSQPGGASVALRKLVEEARRANRDADRIRAAQEATYRFMSAMAGNLPGYEEATRALFDGDSTSFDELVDPWPQDVREHAKRLAASAFAPRDGDA